MLLDKAKNLGDRLSGAFTLSGGGLPMGQVNLRDGQASPLSWMGGGLGLAEVGTFQLEFAYLGHVLGGEEGKQYINRVDRANDALQKLRSQLKVKGLYPFKIMPGFDNPSWAYDGSYKIGGGVDSFYEYLVKQWIMLSKEPTHLREMFDEAAKAMIENLGVNKTVNGRQLVFFPDGNPGAPGSSHEHLACFMGGTLALAARTWEPEEGMAPDEIEKQKQWQEQVYEWGKGFTKTCRDSYADQRESFISYCYEF